MLSIRNLFWQLVAAALMLLCHGRASAADDPATLAECSDAYDQCFASAGFFGYFYCPQAYAQCVAEVRSQLPPEINQLLDQVDTCTRISARCRTAAEGEQDKLASCARHENVCIMDAFGIVPPEEGPKDMLCVQTALRCLRSAQAVSGLQACQQTLARCLAAPVPPL